MRKCALKNAFKEIAKAAKIVDLIAKTPRRVEGMDNVISISISIQRGDAQIRFYTNERKLHRCNKRCGIRVVHVFVFGVVSTTAWFTYIQRLLGLIRTHNEWNFVPFFDVVSSHFFEWFLSKLSVFIIHFVFGMNFKRILFWFFESDFFTNLNAITSISIDVFSSFLSNSHCTWTEPTIN